MTKINTLVIGGGLSGLSVSNAPEVLRDSHQLVEARDRFGGRILSRDVAGVDGSAKFDLGPTWFWPGQARIKKLIERLGLQSFEQYASGDLLYQDARGHVQRGRGHSSMEGSLRLAGGIGALIDALAEPIRPNALLATKAIEMRYEGDAVHTLLEAADGSKQTISSDCVVLAIPPRVAVETIQFGEGISEHALDAMRAVPTWMAGHAKAVAVYDRPFWREAGLSGDAMSMRGPLSEVHDASPRFTGPFALFGFFGIDPKTREQHQELLPKLVTDQLVELFGPDAQNPIDIVVKDWALDVETATERDLSPSGGHPRYGLMRVLRELWDGRLILGSTEAGTEFGGYLEGALEAAENAAAAIERVRAGVNRMS